MRSWAEGFYSLCPHPAAERAAGPPHWKWLCVLSLRQAELEASQAQQVRERAQSQ